MLYPKKLKGESGLFLTPVLMHGVAVILAVTYGGELLYLRIWRDLRTLSLQHDSPHDNHYECVVQVHGGKRELMLAWGA